MKNAKKKTPKQIKKELDTLWSKTIRDRDRTCQKCGKTNSTQAAHIFGRGRLSTRWECSNGVGLCFYCHLYWAHREPVEFTIWIMERMGKEKFNRLKKKSQEIYDPSNLQTDYERLKVELSPN